MSELIKPSAELMVSIVSEAPIFLERVRMASRYALDKMKISVHEHIATIHMTHALESMIDKLEIK